MDAGGIHRENKLKEVVMAGIKEALKRVAEQKHECRVLAKGVFGSLPNKVDSNGEMVPGTSVIGAKYLIMQRKPACVDGGLITAYDYGSDIRISDKIERGDDVILMIRSNWCAEWIRKEDVGD